MLRKFLAMVTSLCLLLALSACVKQSSGDIIDYKNSTTPPDDVHFAPSFAAMPKKSQSMAELYSIGDAVALSAFITPGMDSMLTELVSYDLSSDTMLGELNLGERRVSIFPSEDSFAVLDHDSKVYTVYNTACEEQSSVNIKFDGFIGTAYQNGDNLLLSDMRFGNYYIYHLPTSTTVRVEETMTADIFSFVGSHMNGFVVQSHENGLMMISTDGTVQSVRKVSDGIQVVGSAYVGGVAGDYTVFHSLNGGESIMIPVHDNAEAFFCAEDNRFLSIAECDSHGVLHCYDMDHRTVIEYEITGYVSDAVLFGDGVLAAVHVDYEAPVTLTYIDFSELPAKSIDAAAYDDDAVAGRRPLPEVSGIAAEIRETYGVTVIGEVDFFDFNVIGYTATPTNDARIIDLLDNVRDVLSFFPEGIFKEIGEKTPVVIVMCEALSNGAAGINTVVDGYNVSYVSVTGKDNFFESSTAHELAHAIERQISRELLEGWVTMQPEEVQSAYGNLYLTVEFTADDKGKTPVWFVNGAYGRSEPIEDRATLFALMYDSYTEGDTSALNYEGLRKKMDYWSLMIRETYDCCENKNFAWDNLFD